jgi:hypothetical protein
MEMNFSQPYIYPQDIPQSVLPPNKDGPHSEGLEFEPAWNSPYEDYYFRSSPPAVTASEVTHH